MTVPPERAGVFPETIETDSLALRKLSPAHVDVFELYECFAAGTEGADEVFENVPMAPFDTVADAHGWLQDAPAEWDDGESAKYAVFRGDETVVGTAALAFHWDRRTANLAVILAKPHWGQGYGTECARALADLAFDRLDLELIELSHEAGNERSQAAIRAFVDRVGGQYEGRLRNWTPLDGEVLDTHRYTIHREEYEPGA